MGRHLVCTDLHGNGLLWSKIKEKLNVDDTLYFLGDAIDRGPDGFLIMLDMLKDPRVIYIKGNHEQFAIDFLRVARDIDHLNDVPHDIINLWHSNGGSKTINDIWSNLTKDETKRLYLCLKNLPERMEVTINDTVFLLSHAGYTPRYLTRDLADDRQVLLWNREHFLDAWDESRDGENVISIGGHTPTCYLSKIDDGFIVFDRHKLVTDKDLEDIQIITYANGHKIDLDLCSAFSNRAALYCLETKEVFYIDVN